MKKNALNLFLLIVLGRAYGQSYAVYDSIQLSSGSYFLAFDQESDNLLACTNEGTLYIIKSSNTDSVFPVPLSRYMLNTVSVNNKYIAVSDSDGNVYLIDKRTKKLKQSIKSPDNITTLLFVKDELFFGGNSGHLYKQSFNKPSALDSIFYSADNNNAYSITDIKYNPFYQHLVVCAGNIIIIPIKPTSSKTITRILSPEMDFSTLAIQGKSLAAWSYYQKFLLFWPDYIRYPNKVDTLIRNDEAFASHLKFLNDSLLLTGKNNKVVIINVNSKDEFLGFDANHAANVSTVESMEMNKIIVTGDVKGFVWLWRYYKDFNKKTLPVNLKFVIPNINFVRGDSAYLFPDFAQRDLETIYEYYNEYRNFVFKIKLYGFTDAGKDVDQMLLLSEGRVRKLRQDLIDLGIDNDLIEIRGMGISKQIDTIYRENNRRAEIEIIADKEIDMLNKLKELENIKMPEKPNYCPIRFNDTVNLLVENTIQTVIYERENSSFEPIIAENNEYVFFRLNVWSKKPNIEFDLKNKNQIIVLSSDIANGLLKPGYKFKVNEGQVLDESRIVYFYVYGYKKKK